jgi:hypothetical protein
LATFRYHRERLSAPFKIEEEKIKMLPKEESSDSDDKFLINFDDKDQIRNPSPDGMDPRNQNKIRAVTNLRFTSNTLQTSESLAEESGIGLTKKER